jgi:cell shape-determining protein MreC
MKTNFHGNTKHKKRGGRIIFVILAVVLLLNVFDVLWPQTVVRSLLGPVVGVRSALAKPFSGISGAFHEKASLEAENKKLQERITELELAALQATVDTGLIPAITTERETSPVGSQLIVLMRPPFSLYDTLILDARNMNVSVGDRVFAYGVLLGAISHVDATTATVQLFTAPGVKTAIRIGTMDAEAVGQGGGRYIAVFPKDVQIEVGAAVVMPQAFNTIIGAVGAVDVDKNGTFQNVHVSIPVSLNNLSVVTVTPAGVVE